MERSLITCPVCSTQNADTESYCTNCGAFLGADQVEATPPKSDGTGQPPVEEPALDGPTPADEDEPPAGTGAVAGGAAVDGATGVGAATASGAGSTRASTRKAGTRPGRAAPPDDAGSDDLGAVSDEAAAGSGQEADGGQAPPTGPGDVGGSEPDADETSGTEQGGIGRTGAAAAGAGAIAAGAGAAGDTAGAGAQTERVIFRSQPGTTGSARQPPDGGPERVADNQPNAVVRDPTGQNDPTRPGPDEILCPKCGRPNPKELKWCQYDGTELRPDVETSAVTTTTSGGRRDIDPRLIAAGIGVIALIALAAIFLRPGEDPNASAEPSETTAVVSPTPSASAPAQSQPPHSASPSAGVTPTPTPTPPLEPTGLIAYSSTINGDSDIWTVGADGSRPIAVAGDAGKDWDPDLSWDGDMLTWSSTDGVRVADVDGDNGYLLTHHEELDFNPAWSPDGSRIAYSSRRDNEDGEQAWEIYVREAFEGAGPEETITLTKSKAADYEPSWSPDGKRLVFTRGEGSKADLYVQIVPESVDNPVVPATALTDNDAEDITDEDPAWSPDGKTIAFSRTVDGRVDLYLMDLASHTVTPLTDTRKEEHDPAWSPDGAFIAYQVAGRIEIIRADTGEFVDTLDVDGEAAFATWR